MPLMTMDTFIQDWILTNADNECTDTKEGVEEVIDNAKQAFLIISNSCNSDHSELNMDTFIQDWVLRNADNECIDTKEGVKEVIDDAKQAFLIISNICNSDSDPYHDPYHHELNFVFKWVLRNADNSYLHLEKEIKRAKVAYQVLGNHLNSDN